MVSLILSIVFLFSISFTSNLILIHFLHLSVFVFVFSFLVTYIRDSLVAQTVKNLPAIQKTQVQALG